MKLKTALVLLAISLSLCLVPIESSSQEQVLTLPIQGLNPNDTLNQYLAPMTEYGSGHRGIDLPAVIGDEILSPATGEISFIGKVGYRNVISVRFGSSFTASLEPVCSELLEGSLVNLGDSIGFVCEPDPEYLWHCQQTCIHFGTRSEQGYFSPLALMGELSPSRLVFYARG